MAVKKKPAEAPAPDAEPAPDFETALRRLQDIVQAMEDGDLGLEKMMEAFEEGRRLATFCNRRLEAAERKIELLLKQEDGSLSTRPFEEAATTPTPDRAAKDPDTLF